MYRMLEWTSEQQVIDEIKFKKKLMEDTLMKIVQKNILADNDMLTDKIIDKVLGPEVDYTCYEYNL